MPQPYYITTPIYYVNDYPHIGHAYTTVACDAAARYQRLLGRPVYFLTGSDEHGEKIEKSAAQSNEKPIELANRVVERLKKLWVELNISNDDFIRTTEPRHLNGASHLFDEVQKRGDIYLGEYEGWYCVPCETFWPESQLLPGNLCPTCNRPTSRLKESSYFFKMSKFEGQLLAHIEKHPEFIQPESKRNEVLGFIKQGLKDLSVSRTSFTWGIPVATDPKHVIYVWFDALSNYLNAVGYPDKPELQNKWWPATVHMVGKDILRFHAIYWPTFLMAAGLPLPKTIYAHGWWTVEGEKMSKSKGNFIDPFEMVKNYGADPFRYFLLRELPFGHDGDFSHKAFVQRLNSDLANDLGNLTSRTIAMVEKYRQGVVPAPQTNGVASLSLAKQSELSLKNYHTAMQSLNFDQALKACWELMGLANKTIDLTQPWQLAKESSQESELNDFLYAMIETLRLVSAMIAPFMPTMSAQLREKLSLAKIDGAVSHDHLSPAVLKWGDSKVGSKVTKGEALFQRLEEKR